MSRIGKQIITIPQNVTVDVAGNVVRVKGPKGELERVIATPVKVIVADGTVTVDVEKKEDGFERSLWGTFAAHVKNMVVGVSEGFEKTLEINGVGYKVALQGKDLRLDVGFSHPVIYVMPAEVTAGVEKNVIKLQSANKELLGKVAAEVRAVKKPEPYKGKGIKYSDEVIRRKAGKAAKSA